MNHGVWLPKGETPGALSMVEVWTKFFSDGTQEVRVRKRTASAKKREAADFRDYDRPETCVCQLNLVFDDRNSWLS